MTVFACAGCGTPLTVPLSRVMLPAHARQRWGHALLGVLMEPGSYAVNPDPCGPPWRAWDELGDEVAQARGWYAPVEMLPDGPRGAVVIAPGDLRGTVFIADRCDGYCLGLDGRLGPNLACARCGRPVATRIDDCSWWQAVWLDPGAVRPVTDDVPRPPPGWEGLREERPGLPPDEPSGSWSPQWEAAVGAAVARLLVVSGGARVAFPAGLLLAAVLRRPFEVLVPPGGAVRTLVLAGPGLPVVTSDLALVPQHPQTGEHWTPPEPAKGVPLAWDIWIYLALQGDRRSALADGVAADALDARPPALIPPGPFRIDRAVFLETLARLPEVRQPWLREIYDQVRHQRDHCAFW